METDLKYTAWREALAKALRERDEARSLAEQLRNSISLCSGSCGRSVELHGMTMRLPWEAK